MATWLCWRQPTRSLRRIRGVILWKRADQVRISRCSFPPGATHVCHSHPAYLFYVLSGGKAQVRDEKGTREVEIRSGSHVDAPPVPWHEVTNIGNTTLQFLNVEKKYRPAPSVSQTVCPSKAR